jgi:hypothetical protein
MLKMMFTLFMADKIHCAHILVKTETEAKNINRQKRFSMPVRKEQRRPRHFYKGQDG